MTAKQERYGGLTKTAMQRDLAHVKNMRDELIRLTGNYFWAGYVMENLDMLQGEIEDRLNHLKELAEDKKAQ